MAWDRDKERKAGKAMTLGNCIYGVCFMIFWCTMVAWMEAWIMLLFGIPGLVYMIFRLVVCIRMMKEKKKKETDPWDRPVAENSSTSSAQSSSNAFCPYCGEPMQEGFAYCPKCGRKQDYKTFY